LNGDRHPGNVAQANGGGKGRRHRLKVANIPLFIGGVVTPQGHINGVLKPPQVDKPHPQGKKAGPQQQPEDNQGQAPHPNEEHPF
jgi:hypothetical protein